MANWDPHQGRASEEAPRLLALETWIRGARVLWVGAVAEESIEWLHRLGAARVSVVGTKMPGGLRADVYLEPDGLSAVPSQRSDLIVVQDFGARLAAEPDLFNDLERLLSPEGRMVGILPSDGEHVGVDMLAHSNPRERLSYAKVIELLEARFDYVTAVAQVPLLGYLITGTSEDRSLQFDGRLADLAQEPPIYHLVAGFKTPPAPLTNRIATLSFDRLSDRVGQVVASLSEDSNATRLEANRTLAQLEQQLESRDQAVNDANAARQSEAKKSKRLERQLDGLKSELNASNQQLEELTDRVRQQDELLAEAERQALSSTEGASHWEATAQQLRHEQVALQANLSDSDQLVEDLRRQVEQRDRMLTAASLKSDQLQHEATRWEGRVEEFLRLSLRLENEQAELQATLESERQARAADPMARELVARRVAHQTMAASAHQLAQTAERRRKEMAELMGRLRRAQSQQRQSEDLLREAQTRLEVGAAAAQEAHESAMLDHLRGQLKEALALEESLDEERRGLQEALDQAAQKNEALGARVTELEQLRPRLTELEDHARLLKERLQTATQAQEAGEELTAQHRTDLEQALEREALLQARSIELAEAVSNLAARVDLLETEASDQIETLAEAETERDELKAALGEERVLSAGLRQQLEEVTTALNTKVVDDDTQSLRDELAVLESRYQASLEALQQQGAEAALHEEEHRRLELENQRLRASNLARKNEPSERVVELQQRIHNLDEERQRLEGELSSLRAKADQQSVRLAQMDGMDGELETLRSDRSVLSAEVERLTPFESMSAELTKVQEEKDATLADLTSQLEQRQELCDQLRKQLDRASASAERAKTDLEDQVQAARRDLETQLAQTESEAQKAALEGNELGQAFTALKTDYDALLARQDQLVAERDGLNGRVNELLLGQASLLQQQTEGDDSAGVSLAEHAQKLADAQAIELELRDNLSAAREGLDEALAARLAAEKSEQTSQYELAAMQKTSAEAQASVAQLEAEIVRTEEAFEAEREAMLEQHDTTMQQQLAQAADVQRAQINKLETELADLQTRSAAIQAQEDRILQLVEEQRQAADQAWDLAIAQRTARFAALIDRFDQVVHATIQKEGQS